MVVADLVDAGAAGADGKVRLLHQYQLLHYFRRLACAWWWPTWSTRARPARTARRIYCISISCCMIAASGADGKAHLLRQYQLLHDSMIASLSEAL